MNVITKRLLFDGFKSFHIELVREWKFIKFCGNGLRLQDIDSPECEVNIRCRSVTTFGTRSKKFHLQNLWVPNEDRVDEGSFLIGKRGHFCSSLEKN